MERASRPPALAELSDPFVVRLLQLLRDQDRARRGSSSSRTSWPRGVLMPNEVLHREQSQQAANQVTVGNCVLSLRLLSAVDWNAFFEQTSHVEAILREDPAGIYPRQDFATSDRYRRAVEMIARGSKADEIEVAQRAVELARRDRRLERTAQPCRLLPDRPRPGGAEDSLSAIVPAGASACRTGSWASRNGLFRVDYGQCSRP